MLQWNPQTIQEFTDWQEDTCTLPVPFVDPTLGIIRLTNTKEIGRRPPKEITSGKETWFMQKPNMATRIESGETTVTDKWTVLKIMLFFLLGALLIGIGIGLLIN